jgi:hypothetical protein
MIRRRRFDAAGSTLPIRRQTSSTPPIRRQPVRRQIMEKYNGKRSQIILGLFFKCIKQKYYHFKQSL